MSQVNKEINDKKPLFTKDPNFLLKNRDFF